MKEIFSILKYILDNVTFETYESLGTYELIETKKNSYGPVFKTDNGTFESNRYVTYATEKPKGSFDYNKKHLPYIADVTEDLPGSIKLEPKTFPSCQLMTEKHGGYLQFWDEKNQEVHRIAMNSNTYTLAKGINGTWEDGKFYTF